MSTLAIVLVVIAAIFLLLFLGGLAMSARRRASPRTDAAIASADRALADAQASDRGWDRALLEAAATGALAEQRPGFQWQALQLVLVDDRPGVVEDRAHLRASGTDGSALVVLTRSEQGEWLAERVE
jgi:hypothetical protein